MPVRVRIAPSPTGFMHIGNLRTALTNFLFARSQGGSFLVRLEDTDQKRFVEGSAIDVINSLKWAGLTWDEGIDLGSSGSIIEKGEFGPYIQSKRLPIYQQHIQELIDKGMAYYCFCSPDRLSSMRQEQTKQGQPPMYDRSCLKLPKSKIEEKLRKNEPYVIRLKMPDSGRTSFNDLIRGEVSIENKLIDDQVLMKSDGYPTYHFGVVVDDHLMNITHVLRAEEWVPSTPKHILIYQAFGWEVPEFGHLPQLLNMNGKKLSKRDGDVAVRDFIKKGYLPEAIINFIALLGWNPKTTQEMFSLEELVRQFDIKKINKAGAKFDYTRLNWFGSQYIKQLDDETLYERTKEYFEPLGTSREKAKKIVAIQKERIPAFAEITKGVEYLLAPAIEYDSEMLRWKEMAKQDIIAKLEDAKCALINISEESFVPEELQKTLMEVAGENRGELLWPLRVALTGQVKSPSPFECAWILGKEETIRRIDSAVKKLGLRPFTSK